MYDERADLLTALRSGPVVLRTLLNVVTDRAGSDDGEDEWSAVEIVCHLRDAERIALERDQLIESENRPTLSAYDQDELAEKNAYASQDLATAVREFEELRMSHVAFLEGIPAANWGRVGVHEEFGELTIQQHVAHMAAHDPLHFAQLARFAAARMP